MSGNDYCRLCSSPKNLISMFGGKSRVMRESLRKMIELTVVVQIEHCDAVASVCFNCLVDVTNFYYFKLNCLNNQRNFEARVGSFSTCKKFKVNSKYLEDIPSPDIVLTQEVLDWLESKRKGLGPPKGSKIFTDKESQTFLEKCNVFTQSELVETISNGSQTNDIKLTSETKSFADKKCQTFLKKCNVYTQSVDSDVSKKAEKTIQTKTSNSSCDPKNNFPRLKTKNSYSQTHSPKKTFKNCYSQTNNSRKNSHTTDKESQTFLERCDVVTQSEIVETISNGSQTDDLRVSNSSCDPKNNFPKLKTKNSYSPTHSPKKTFKNCYSQTNNSRKNLKNSLTTDKESQTFLERCDVVTQSEIVQTISNASQTDDLRVSDSSCDPKNNFPKLKTKNSYSQTHSPKKTFKNCYSQTNNSRKNFKNSQTDAKDVSIELSTRDSCRKTELPNTVDQQPLPRTNGHNCQNLQTEATDVTTHTSVLEKNCQTEAPQTKTVSTQYDLMNIFNSFYSKDFVSPTSQIDSKLDIKFSFKEEKLSPLECLSISTTPKHFEPVSPNFSGLLQVQSKSECVKICKICDQCLYSKKEMLVHRKTHMVCRFCKKKFKSLKDTQNHVQVCEVKEMNLLPFVTLVKIDEQPTVVEQYSTAFNGLNNCL